MINTKTSKDKKSLKSRHSYLMSVVCLCMCGYLFYCVRVRDFELLKNLTQDKYLMNQWTVAGTVWWCGMVRRISKKITNRYHFLIYVCNTGIRFRRLVVVIGNVVAICYCRTTIQKANKMELCLCDFNLKG